ncbi:uncharacterized protein MELLADRAFT_109299 [Melampsora larici-populina 98AG31]|uniref:CCHC-type domain-containing protein n=1 Tax=Melampsora larici-populina (strain 98AG31 / pathotype 3-4-7) TaxID=747676 RepID=F4RW10_MELLP|nr:uncharacterized protein MELLADRAFT_109299 [Melampsora larici-populina 98AG31]EGG03453.1 hypothetical protein MELLADRAFT_109299 [Melampsora larici-populina 98AG31]
MDIPDCRQSEINPIALPDTAVAEVKQGQDMCYWCGGFGHMQNVCPSRRAKLARTARPYKDWRLLAGVRKLYSINVLWPTTPVPVPVPVPVPAPAPAPAVVEEVQDNGTTGDNGPQNLGVPNIEVQEEVEIAVVENGIDVEVGQAFIGDNTLVPAVIEDDLETVAIAQPNTATQVIANEDYEYNIGISEEELAEFLTIDTELPRGRKRPRVTCDFSQSV